MTQIHTVIKILLFRCPESFCNLLQNLPVLSQMDIMYTRANVSAPSGNFDLIFLPGPEFFKNFTGPDNREKKSQTILLLEGDFPFPQDLPDNIVDVWRFPPDKEELSFKFLRWQKNYQDMLNLDCCRRFLNIAMDTSPNLIWFKDREGRHELVNSTFCKTVGKTREQVTGQKHAYIWNVEQDDPACIESERIVMESGHTHVSEETIQTGEGLRQLTTYKSPILNRDGSIWGTLGIGVDVTREKAFQSQLIRNNATLESIFTTMDCGVLCHSLDGEELISANRAALTLLGYKSEPELQKDFHTMAGSVMECDKQQVKQALAKMRNLGDSASYEYRVILPDGQLRHVMGNAKVIEKDGRLVCQRLLLDWTRQKFSEDKIKSEQEKRHKEIIRALSMDYQLVFVLDSKTGDSNILQLRDYPDPKLKQIFAEEPNFSAAFEKYINTCVHPEERDILKKIVSFSFLQTELDQKNVFYFNFRTIFNNKPHHFQLKAVRAGSRNHAHGFVIGLQSINQRIQQEMEQNNKLATALKQAQKANEAKTMFLSNMSHDIRTPMNAVVGYATLALKQLDKMAHVESYLEKILISGRHLLSLINDILDMSHIESGKLQLDEQICSLKQIMDELFNILRPTSNEKKQTLTCEMSEVKTDWIYCDKLRLNQVLLNVLSNSVKYTPNNGHINMIITQKKSPESETVVFEFKVCDDGIGMSQEFLERIFEPFERAQTSTMVGIVGTGLGMSITKKIIQMMRGDIKIKSQLDKGTEVIFTLPFRIATPKKVYIGNSQNRQPPQDINKNKNIRILLAEDNEMNQEIAKEFLNDAGYIVDIASNGQEAIEKLSKAGENYYSVILMDVQMPIMNGYEATEIIRSLPNHAFSKIPIIALTANSFDEDRQEALRRGMTAHIAKPINFPDLLATLDNLLKNK